MVLDMRHVQLCGLWDQSSRLANPVSGRRRAVETEGYSFSRARMVWRTTAACPMGPVRHLPLYLALSLIRQQVVVPVLSVKLHLPCMSPQCYLWHQVRLMNVDEEEVTILQHISADRLANPECGRALLVALLILVWEDLFAQAA